MISNNKRTFIIAEAGVNHNGSIDKARQLIEVAAEAGADAIKFQTFKAEQVISSRAPKAEYQLKTTKAGESQLEMIKKLELDQEAHLLLLEHCQKSNLQFVSTPFDYPSLDLLVNVLNLDLIKIPSGEITNAPFLLRIARTGKPVILSTGMSTLGEVETALNVLAFGYTCNQPKPAAAALREAYCSKEGQQALCEKVTLLQCTTEYPAPYGDVNLRAMETMKHAFNLPVGLSDHTPGIAIAIAAAAREACVIEKHFTLDRNLPGPDHKASLEPNELKEMIIAIRQVEEALGSPLKAPAPSEIKNISMARKSVVATKSIKKGVVFTDDNITVKRPGDGISPMYYWDLVGKRAKKNICKDACLEWIFCE